MKNASKKISKMLLLLASTSLVAVSCSTNPHKAEKIETNMDKKDNVSSDSQIGVKDGNMVFQRKVEIKEELRRLQNDVYSLEDRVYGNRNYGSLGLYGVLKKCKEDLADKRNGGDGKLTWTEPLERVTNREDDLKLGLDENEKLVGVTVEFLKDRIDRFRGYRNVLEKREDEYTEKISICRTELKSRKADEKSAER